MYTQPAFLNADSGVQVINTTFEMAVVPGLHPGVTYDFTVVAYNAVGDSSPSNITSITTLEEGMSVTLVGASV